jgi:hypothetical protein
VAKSTGKLRKGPKDTALSNAGQPYRSQIESWLSAYLSNEYALNFDKVSADQKLKAWGYGDPVRLALLAGNYNRTTASRPLVRPISIPPPELIRAVLGRRIQDLIDFLARKHEESTINLPAFRASLDLPDTARDSQLSADVADLLSSTDALYQNVWHWTYHDLETNYPEDVITPTTPIANVFDVDGDIEKCALRFKYAVLVAGKFGPVRDSDAFSISTDSLESLRADKKKNLAQLAQLFTQRARIVLETDAVGAAV